MREYCCPNCGLIWFNTSKDKKVCIECKHEALYAVDTFGFFYAKNEIKESLEKRGKEIHYHEEHPRFNKIKYCPCKNTESLKCGIKCSNCGREL